MISIAYPPHEFRIRKESGAEMIFDEIRKSWLKLTPEEWVRQNFVRYLIISKNYPQALIAVEKKIMVGELPRRFDILVYDRRHTPWMMIECKAMTVALTEEVFSQVLRYHIAVPAKYLVITNGSYCMAFEKTEGRFVEIEIFPETAG
jgi:hypothetical protein